MHDELGGLDPSLVAEWRCRAKSKPTDTLAVFDAGGPPGLDTATRRWLSGVACFEMGDATGAIGYYDAAVLAIHDDWRPHVEISRMGALTTRRAQDRSASRRLEELCEHNNPVVSALALSQKGLNRVARGELVDAETMLRLSVEPLRTARYFEDAFARVVGNLGVAVMLQGRIVESIPLHTEALEIARRIGYPQIEAGSLQNIGYAAMRLGRFPEAIARLMSARAIYETMDGSRRGYASLLTDLAETHRLAGLFPEAVDYAEMGVAVASEGSNAESLAEAQLHLAACLLAAGHPGPSRQIAAEVDAHSMTGDRPVQVARARLIASEAELKVHPDIRDDQLAQMVAGIDEIFVAGWTAEADRLTRTLALRLVEADEELPAGLIDHRSNGDTDGLVPTLEATMRRALRSVDSCEDFHEAIAQARSDIADHTAVLYDGELRAGVAALGADFDRLEAIHCMRRGEGRELLDGRLASSALHHSIPSDAEADAKGAALLDQIRSITNATMPGTERNAQIRDLERRYGEMNRARQASVLALPSDIPGRRAELGHLAGSADVVLIANLGCHYATLRVDGDAFEIVGTTDRRQVDAQAHKLRRSFQRLMFGCQRSDQATALDVAAVRGDARLLSDALLPAIAPGGSVVVVAPTGLVGLPWRLIAAPAGSVIVSPSLAHLCAPATSTDRVTAMVVAGPRLEHFDTDIAAVRSAFTHCVSLEGAEATAEALRNAVASCDVVHLAAHGSYRHDAPRFSSLELHDGPLMLHDLTPLRAQAQLVFLAACDAARAHSVANAAGTAGRLLEAGVTGVVAPISPVPDRESSLLVASFYEAFGELSACAALSEATTGLSWEHDARQWATAHAFQYFGGADVSYLSPPSRL